MPTSILLCIYDAECLLLPRGLHNAWSLALFASRCRSCDARVVAPCGLHVPEHQSNDSQLKSLRLGMRDLKKEYDKSEEDLKNLQCVGQIVGEVLRQVTSHAPAFTVLCWWCGLFPCNASLLLLADTFRMVLLADTFRRGSLKDRSA